MNSLLILDLLRHAASNGKSINYYLPPTLLQIVAAIKSEGNLTSGINRVIALYGKRLNQNPFLQHIAEECRPQEQGFEQRLLELANSTNHTYFRHAAQALASIGSNDAGYSKRLEDLVNSSAADDELSGKSVRAWTIPVEQLLLLGGLKLNAKQWSIVQVTWFGICVLFLLTSGSRFTLFVLFIGILPSPLLRVLTFPRIQKQRKDLAALIMLMRGLHTAGLEPLTALREAGKKFSEHGDLYNELQQLEEKLRSRMKEDEAVLSFGESMPLAEVQLLRNSIVLTKNRGADFGNILKQLTHMLLKREERL